jgi:hypothetical protein
VEVGEVAAAPDGRLVPGGDVGKGTAEGDLGPPQQARVDLAQVGALGLGEGGKVGKVRVRVEVKLDRPAGGEGDEGAPVGALVDDALAGGEFGGESVGKEVAASPMLVVAGERE